MILYNTLMGVAAGAALILVPVLGRKLLRREPVMHEGRHLPCYWPRLRFAVLVRNYSG